MGNGKKTVRSRRGQSEVVSTVILIAVVLVLAAIFIIIAMINFGRASASTSLSLAESFMTNVADDMEASMYSPGTVLVYPLPSTPYGVFNLISNYCDINITVYSRTYLMMNYLKMYNFTYHSGALIYGVPPSYLSLPTYLSQSSGSQSRVYMQVIRGSLTNGAYDITNESTIVENAAAPLISIVQFGAANVGGVSYGTYVVLFPRVLVVNETNETYVYIPVINVVPSNLRNTLVINITSISTYSIPLNTYSISSFSVYYIAPSYVDVSDSCGPLSDSLQLPVRSANTTLRIVVVNITMTFR